MIEKIKREISVKKATRGVKGHGLIKYINGLPKNEIRTQSTIKYDGELISKTNPTRQYIKDFWSGSGCTMDRLLYEQVINAKNNI